MEFLSHTVSIESLMSLEKAWSTENPLNFRKRFRAKKNQKLLYKTLTNHPSVLEKSGKKICFRDENKR